MTSSSVSALDFERGLVRINGFATVINHDVVASVGKSRDAIRTVDIDEHLAQVLRQQPSRTPVNNSRRWTTK